MAKEQSPLPPSAPSRPPPSPLSSTLLPPAIAVARPVSRLTIVITQTEAANTANHRKRRKIKLPVGHTPSFHYFKAPVRSSPLPSSDPCLCQALILTSAKLCKARSKTPRILSAPHLCQAPLIASANSAKLCRVKARLWKRVYSHRYPF